MIIHSSLRGKTGFVTAWNRMVRFQYMASKEAKRRLKILAHAQMYGIESALDAFEVKRRTLFNWRKLLKDGNGELKAISGG
jgi:hypothetical protein